MSKEAVDGAGIPGPLYFTLKISRYFGLTPITVVTPTKALRIYADYKYYGYLVLVLLSTFLIYVLFEIDIASDNDQGGFKSKFFAFLRIIVSGILFGVAVYYSIERTQILLTSVDKIQKIVTNLSGSRLEVKQKKFYYILIFVLVLGLSLKTIRIFKSPGNNLLVLSTFLITDIVVILLKFQFVLAIVFMLNAIRKINQCFENLNDRLGQHQLFTLSNIGDFPGNISQGSVEVVTRNTNIAAGNFENIDPDLIILSRSSYANELHKMKAGYFTVCRTIKEFSNSQGPCLLLLFCVILLEIAITLCGVARSLESPDFAPVVFQLIWSFFHALNLYVMVEPCHKTLAEMNQTRAIVSRLLSQVVSDVDPTLLELNVFSRQLYMKKQSFAMMDIYSLNRPLLITVVSGMIAILLIIIDS